MRSVFEYETYKSYLNDRAKAAGRGEKSRIARHVRCHVAYVSQVLGGHADFSLEQADALNAYCGHAEEEGDFFLLLVSRDRAGTAALREHFAKRIRRTLRDRLELANRLRHKRTLEVDRQAIYYSAWYYGAIHLLISIPGYRTAGAIAEHLRLPLAQVGRVLDFLVSSGLAERRGEEYGTGEVTLHLANDSPWIARHHSNWRIRATQAVDTPDLRNFHYTSVISMAEKDVPAVRLAMIEAVERIRAIVKASPEEQVFCYALDFFGV